MDKEIPEIAVSDTAEGQPKGYYHSQKDRIFVRANITLIGN